MKKLDYLEEFNTIEGGGTGEISEKKSRFIASVIHMETEEAAIARIEELKKKYWDATHNCYAYIIGEKAHIVRCSDDGEPAGTAGKPILEVLLGKELRNVLVVVTRYFGGTLLGTGGLIRAYSQAAKAGIEQSELVTMQYVARYLVTTDYNGIGKIQYLLGTHKIAIEHAEYAQDVVLQVVIPAKQVSYMINEMTEITNGKIKMEEVEYLYLKK